MDTIPSLTPCKRKLEEGNEVSGPPPSPISHSTSTDESDGSALKAKRSRQTSNDNHSDSIENHQDPADSKQAPTVSILQQTTGGTLWNALHEATIHSHVDNHNHNVARGAGGCADMSPDSRRTVTCISGPGKSVTAEFPASSVSVVGPDEEEEDKKPKVTTPTSPIQGVDMDDTDSGKDDDCMQNDTEDAGRHGFFSSLAGIPGTSKTDTALADIDSVDGALKRGAAVAAASYVVLVSGICYFGPTTDDHEDDPVERRVPQTAFFILLVSSILQMLPFMVMRIRASNMVVGVQVQQTTPSNISAYKEGISGIIVAAMVIMSVSMTSNAILGWGPRYAVTDPFTGSPVFLIRWAEWIPLSGFMTLLAESADISTHRHAWRGPIIFGLCQTLSTLCGIVLPFCQTFSQWMIVMIFSCVFYILIVPRVLARRDAFLRLTRGSTVVEREHYDRRRFAYYLMALCALFWTVLVAFYFVNLVIHTTFPLGHWLRFPSLAMTCDTIADVLAKVIYTRIIVDAHEAVFASDQRMLRQLNELKRIMSMLWISSSDVIVISTRHTKHRNATMLSPSFLSLVGATPPLHHQNSNLTHQNRQLSLDRDADKVTSVGQSAALVLETDRGKVVSAYYVDTPTISEDPHLINTERNKVLLAYEDLQHNVVQQALRITNAAWASRNSDDPLRALSVNHCDESRENDKVLCEMKVSRYTEQTAVAIVRDVTERYRRFEAESRAHAETIARQRDMHTANRFTRHEVKNGLLAGLELCRTLGQSLNKLKDKLDQGIASQGIGDHMEKNTLMQTATLLEETTIKSLLDLDGTLHGVLDTVLAEVMAREVVHGVYQPRLEELDVPSMLVSDLGLSKERIPITVEGGSMPKLLLDAQLIGHIHRNAVSNACKYGKQGGIVQTVLCFDSAQQQFRLEVTNEPGDAHATLVALGETAGEFIFAQGVRLQAHMDGNTEKIGSSGDGAWIMQKCAKVLKGECDIHFSKNLTKFTFQCPAVPVQPNEKPKYIDFVVPRNAWAIGVDDSKIQRKLMSRIFSHVGVTASKQVLLGESPEDVTEFESTLMTLMEEHPTDKFLVIVDEHLVRLSR
jgi:hypothetical protein